LLIFLQRLRHKFKRWWNKNLFTIWYDPAYRLPISSLGARLRLEPRRADYTLWYLLDVQAITHSHIRTPLPVPYNTLELIHDEAYLESLTDAEKLADIFCVDLWDIQADELMRSIRLATGATVQAAQDVLQRGGIALNLLGGFHHASPRRGGGLCPINDIAVAVAALRHDGFTGRIAIIDCDAHPPDGIDDCLANDPSDIWIGSISAADWGPLHRTDETVIASGADDGTYLRTLTQLLSRMPKPDLAFVIAGGDVLAGDHMGGLALTLEGARERDITIAEALTDVPSVWLPGGGYHRDAWKILAGTGLALASNARYPIPPHYQPLSIQFHKISKLIAAELSDDDQLLTDDDIASIFGPPHARPNQFLGYYTANRLEYALCRYGILEYLRRLGYYPFNFVVDATNIGDRFRLFADKDKQTHLLVEFIAEKHKIRDQWMLYIHWLTLRNPAASFSDKRPKLPGQETPGLGLASEATILMTAMAKRLHLQGVAFQPAWYHIAYAMRRGFQFVNHERQGRFEAMIRDIGDISLLEATCAIANKQILCNNQPYTWESGIMASWAVPTDIDRQAISCERDRHHFTISPDGDCPK
jgi:acetoin utilization deacetylase AcuC-like enzyme